MALPRSLLHIILFLQSVFLYWAVLRSSTLLVSNISHAVNLGPLIYLQIFVQLWNDLRFNIFNKPDKPNLKRSLTYQDARHSWAMSEPKCRREEKSRNCGFRGELIIPLVVWLTIPLQPSLMVAKIKYRLEQIMLDGRCILWPRPTRDQPNCPISQGWQTHWGWWVDWFGVHQIKKS